MVSKIEKWAKNSRVNENFLPISRFLETTRYTIQSCERKRAWLYSGPSYSMNALSGWVSGISLVIINTMLVLIFPCHAHTYYHCLNDIPFSDIFSPFMNKINDVLQ